MIFRFANSLNDMMTVMDYGDDSGDSETEHEYDSTD